MPSIPLIPGRPTSSRITRGADSAPRACSAASHEEKVRKHCKPSLPLITRANASRYASLSSISQIWMGEASTSVRPDKSLAAERVLLLILVAIITEGAGLTITRSSDVCRQVNGCALARLTANLRRAAQLRNTQPQVFQSIACMRSGFNEADAIVLNPQ